MPKFQLSNAELASAVSGRSPEFPKYTTQIMNLANQNAQGTRPKVVGQMTELFPEFGESPLANGTLGTEGKSREPWMMRPIRSMQW